MDECMLNDLLECSVCLERLDTSSKVLPCQHTFCKRCLEEIVTTHKELRCPECRVLVDIKIDDLPPNVLLMRILEGMRNAAPKKDTQSTQQQQQHHQRTIVSSSNVRIQQTQQNISQHIQSQADNRNFIQQNKGTIVPQQQVLPHQPYGRALYDYVSTESDDLSFKKGDIILLRKRMDMHWYLGECNGKHGLFPSAFVQVIIPLPCHIPQCKALYDFRMSGEDEEGCLAFSKGAVINVIRRVDENWAEGRLNDRVGIFPLAFVELNGLARSLMKLSTNSQPGPSRVAPPTPTSEDSTPLISTDLNNHHQQAPSGGGTGAATAIRQGSDSSSTISSTSPSTTPNTSSSNTSSSSSTAPSSPTSPPPRSTTTTSTTPSVQSPPSSARPTQSHREKRHSFSAINSGSHHHSNHRHSAEILSTDHSESTEDGIVTTQQNGMTPPSTNLLPAAYIALYSYTPQKPDELELRKGGIYMVTERCQDGWFKGTSNRTQKCGVFPGNYVAPARGIPARVTTSASAVRGGGTVPPPLEPRVTAASSISYTRNKSINNSLAIRSSPSTPNNRPPELPPRSVSPATAPTSTVSCSWHHSVSADNSSMNSPLGRSQSAVMSSPNTTTSCSPSPKSIEKSKERKEKGTVSLMRRLTSMKRSKSPPPTTYSMDNPVFEDSQNPSILVHSQITSQTSSTAHPVHVRHGGDSLIMSTSTSNHQNHHHRKSNSLDAGSKSTSSPGGPGNGGSTKLSTSSSTQQIRERFRCIVPYPPNSEYELELRLNDIIYVHKKRDDGWYKGTQQRTGRTGLFPASFVESF
ncbi:E3 ubiquitin-protein ligase SH3RF3 isoform X2 [Chrysoperla carnea]|uniref:E3 ubiquitin-protein ligase SH3RF3 isoform X2 n=1 Tax=Chrysoperla carnea TaxID=189513 RepID=UPI001D084419|nr:E3 ubiquitin-protein ligase SH3RF3 isoform X2 [Chrysoperla carnea]